MEEMIELANQLKDNKITLTVARGMNDINTYTKTIEELNDQEKSLIKGTIINNLEKVFKEYILEMKKNKYYTPEIEEFHVGFEYEIISTTTGSKVHEWLKMSQPFRMDRMGEWLNKDFIRVKYLDIDDIKDLGFTLVKASPSDYSFEWSIKNNSGSIIGSITEEEGIIDELEIYNTIFEIKNKSELKKLMKQLNIEV